MDTAVMKLKVLLPFRVFLETQDVLSIVAETPQGSFGLLPRRLDCAAALVPGILNYHSQKDGDVYLAIDEGVLVKTGNEVLISVRNAIGDTDLGKLRAAVENEFLNLDEREKNVRAVVAKLESGFVRRFMEFRRG